QDGGCCKGQGLHVIAFEHHQAAQPERNGDLGFAERAAFDQAGDVKGTVLSHNGASRRTRSSHSLARARPASSGPLAEGGLTEFVGQSSVAAKTRKHAEAAIFVSSRPSLGEVTPVLQGGRAANRIGEKVMKLVSFRAKGAAHYGVVQGNGVVDLMPRLGQK